MNGSESTEVDIGDTTHTVEKEEVREAFERTGSPDSNATYKVLIDGETKGAKDVFANIDRTPDNEHFHTRHANSAFTQLGFTVMVGQDFDGESESEPGDRGLYLVKVGDDWIDDFNMTVKNTVRQESLDGDPPSGFGELEGERVWRTGGNEDDFKGMESGDYLLFHHDEEFIASGRVGQRLMGSELSEYIWDNDESKYIYVVKDLQAISLPEQELWSILGWEDMDFLRENLKRVDDESRESLIEEYSTVEGLIEEYEENNTNERDYSQRTTRYKAWKGATRDIAYEMASPPGEVDRDVLSTFEDYKEHVGFSNEDELDAVLDIMGAVVFHPDFDNRSADYLNRRYEDIKGARGDVRALKDSEEGGDDSGINYYWVNQTRETEVENGFLRAPVDSIPHHDLSVLEEGDVVFHYVDKKIIGWSEVVSEARVEKQEGDEYYFVDLELHEYEDKPEINQVNQYLLRDEVRLDKHYPIDGSGGVNQGYMFRLSEEAGNWLRRYGEKEQANDDEVTYWLWNTNYEHQNTDGTAAFQRGVASAYVEEKYGEKLTRPSEGDILFAYLEDEGTRGVGVIKKETDAKPIDKESDEVDPIKEPNKMEYHLPVDWVYTLPVEDCISVSETADILGRDSMSHVSTVEKPSDQEGAQELYDRVRKRYMELNETSNHAEHQNEDIQRLIEDKKQAVFYGPPGTGKTYTAIRFAEWLRAKKDANSLGDKQVRTVTFHPSFSYEDFLEGFTASVEESQVGYDYEKGSFAEMVEDARDAYEATDGDEQAPPFVLIIDEINRGNLAQIFGETITLLEDDKRLGQDNEVSSQLAHSGEDFAVPPNLYVIGTMNTADESIALVDTALRRRFRFLSFPPEMEIVMDNYDRFRQKQHLEEAIRMGNDAVDQLVAASVLAVEELNNRIIDIPSLGKGKQIGHTYLLDFERPQDVVDTWRFEILPQLEEYYFGQFGRMGDELLKEVGEDIIDWETERIESFDAEELYSSLCDIAGIPEEERAELAEVSANPQVPETPQDEGEEDPWVEEKTVENFRERLRAEVSEREMQLANELIDLGEEIGYMDPGGGDNRASVSAKSQSIDPNVGIYIIRGNGNISFKWGWLINRDDNDLTGDTIIPSLERLEEGIDAFKLSWENKEEWGRDGEGPNTPNMPLEEISEKEIEVIKEVVRDFVDQMEQE